MWNLPSVPPSPALALQFGSPSAALGALWTQPSYAPAASSSLGSLWNSSSASERPKSVWTKFVQRGPPAAATTSAKSLSSLAAAPSSRALAVSSSVYCQPELPRVVPAPVVPVANPSSS